MSQETKPYRTNVHLTFPPAISGAPLVCNLTRLFDSISTSVPPDHAAAGRFFDSRTVGLTRCLRQGDRLPAGEGRTGSPVAQRIWHNEDKCMQCGMCTALCPSSALTVDIKTRLLAFDKEKCTVCARCIRICPVGAMQMDAPEEGVLTE